MATEPPSSPAIAPGMHTPARAHPEPARRSRAVAALRAMWQRRWAQTTVFWRTFMAQLALIAIGLAVWVQTFLTLEVEPQALQSAQQIASLVNLTRAALQHADAIERLSLVKTLVDEERLRIAPRERSDSFTGLGTSPFERRMAAALTERLGPQTIVAREVNGFEGLWVAFAMGDDTYWLLLDPKRAEGVQRRTWLLWAAAALLLSVLGAAWVARMVSRPLKRLSEATRQVARGELAAVSLPTERGAREIREVNRGFLNMLGQLQRAERDRQLMLAGISHDLRTPLARLRLEAELSVPDPQAHRDIVADLEQIEAILRQFMDYAHASAADEPASDGLGSPLTDLHALWQQWQRQWPGNLPLHLTWEGEPRGVWVHARTTDLQRVLQNLLENAAKYGRRPGSAWAEVKLSCRVGPEEVEILIEDHGPGVPPELLPRLTEPFFRADAARSQAAGAGLGLAVAHKLMQRAGGALTLANAPTGGLSVRLRLARAPAAPPPAPPCSAPAPPGPAAPPSSP